MSDILAVETITSLGNNFVITLVMGLGFINQLMIDYNNYCDIISVLCHWWVMGKGWHNLKGCVILGQNLVGVGIVVID